MTDEPIDSRRTRDHLDHLLELLGALALALAAVLTAWAAFQSTKWSGVQANSYSRAAATRVESTRASTRAGQLELIDINMWQSWVAAVAAEARSGQPLDRNTDGTYAPDPSRESGFFFERFRDDFRPAVDAWIATLPLTNPEAPPTPFTMREYTQPLAERADQLSEESDALAAKARAANQNGDNYVLMTILFAMVLFFVGVSSKMTTFLARTGLLAAAGIVLVVATLIVASFPKEF